MVEQGAEFWPLKLARELDDAILEIRANEFDIAAIVFKSSGDPAQVLAYDQFLEANKDHWLAREIRGFWKRVLKRIDLTSRSLVALVEPGSCFAGTLAELVFASDRSYMLIGKREGDNKPPATLALAAVNFGAYPMSNGISRLASRFLADPAALERAKAASAEMLDAEAAERLGLVTFALDDIDWDDEMSVRAFPPTRLPDWKRICASAVPRRWNRKSSPASPHGRTGFSSAPTPSARRARSSATAPAKSRRSTRAGCENGDANSG
jgi:benzoyl-CoA-dihydrodiol lyase